MKFIKLHMIILLLISTVCFSAEINFPKIEGWNAADSIQIYDSSNLWEYINGAADLFIDYGFINLRSCEMSSENVNIVVDIYNMGSPLNAFGMYKTERGDVENLFNIGVEAAITAPIQSLLLKDVFYVKINVYEGELSEEKNKKLLQSIAESLPGSNKFPIEFELLPEQNRVNNSDHFTRKSYLGLSELTNCLHANYKDNEDEFQYFVIIPEGNETSDFLWKKFSEKWKNLEANATEILYKTIPYSGIVGIIKTSDGVFGVTNCSSTEQAVKRIKVINN